MSRANKKGGKDSPANVNSSSSSSSSSGGGSDINFNVTLVLSFPSIPIMSLHLSRISAWVEDPEYKGQPLSLTQIVDRKCPAYRYAGHNFTLQAFQQACNAIAPLSKEETNVVTHVNYAIKGLKSSPGHKYDIYIIAHVSGDVRTLNHERCHAIFHYSEAYRKRVEGIWGSVKVSNAKWSDQFVQHLSKMYHTDFHLDEFQAIILNQEYEITQRIVNTLQAAIPNEKNLPCKFIDVKLPIDPNLMQDMEHKKEKEQEEKKT